jgi:uncharacterized protein YjeT (DUF2065 family)
MNKERFANLIFLFAGIYGLIFGLHLPFGSLREPGPAMLPLALSLLLILSGIPCFLRGRRKGKEDEQERELPRGKSLRKLITPLKIVGVTGGFILALEGLGYLLASLLYLFLLFFWISRYRIWAAIALCLVIGLGSWVFFGKVLAVPLPKGILSLGG